jgi:hypothetical protein
MPLVAIASSDGITIDGRIDFPGIFHIYRFDANGKWSVVDQRSPPRRPDRKQLPVTPQAVALLLADVWIILATSVPKETALLLRKRGIMAFSVQGEVSRALDAYSRRGRLFDNLFTHVRDRFPDPASTTTPEER